ncbi:MAG: HD domain-containing protein [Flavobacteriales bacterium]
MQIKLIIMANLQLLFKALNYSAEQHKAQRRKGMESVPYINHPIKVTNIITQFIPDASDDLICAAILHDVVEDTDATIDDIKNKFGDAIASIVQEVTDDKSISKAESRRKQIENAPKLSYNAKIIRVCDKISNVRDICGENIPDWDYKTKIEYLNWAEQVVYALDKFHEELQFAFKDEVRWGRLKIK